MRGDEPRGKELNAMKMNVFPTCVGMNRMEDLLREHQDSVPHMRGDEPAIITVGLDRDACSPHAWG